MEDYDVHLGFIPIMCDNKSVMHITKNPDHHKSTNHIDVRHHFLWNNVEKGHIEVWFFKIEYQLTNVLTKALGKEL